MKYRVKTEAEQKTKKKTEKKRNKENNINLFQIIIIRAVSP